MHDLGGNQGFGPVRHWSRAQVFHDEWEKRANALLALAVKSGFLNMDEYRHAIERMEPRHYLSAGYYERPLTGLLTLLVEKGVVPREDFIPGHIRMSAYGRALSVRARAAMRSRAASRSRGAACPRSGATSS